MRIFVGCLLVVLAGCAGTIAPMDGDTHFLHKKSLQVGFGSADGAKTDVYVEAGEYCDKQKKKVETIKIEVIDPLLLRPGSASLTFRCV